MKDCWQWEKVCVDIWGKQESNDNKMQLENWIEFTSVNDNCAELTCGGIELSLTNVVAMIIGGGCSAVSNQSISENIRQWFTLCTNDNGGGGGASAQVQSNWRRTNGTRTWLGCSQSATDIIPSKRHWNWIGSSKRREQSEVGMDLKSKRKRSQSGQRSLLIAFW